MDVWISPHSTKPADEISEKWHKIYQHEKLKTSGHVKVRLLFFMMLKQRGKSNINIMLFILA